MTSISAWVAFFSNFADEAVILPLSIAIGATFLIFRWQRGAISWLIAVVTTLATVVMLKLFFYIVRGFVDFGINLRSPSSHAAAGALVYGTLLALLLRGSRAGIRTVLASSGAFALFFSLTRIELRVHTRSEVVIGSLLGIIGAMLFVILAGRLPLDTNRRIKLAVVSSLIIVTVYGNRLSGENFIKAVARHIDATVAQAIAGE